MSVSNIKVRLLELLVVLYLINYQIVTIIFNDTFILKYVRDIVLVLIIAINFYSGTKLKIGKQLCVTCLFIVFLLWGASNTSTLSVSILFIRRYLEPILLFLAIMDMKIWDNANYYNFVKFLFNTLFVLCVWGVVQAFILGPSFLIQLGYPTVYLNAYHAIMLKSSFYFGNLGIQRVVSTVSNSNVFALILGMSILFFWMNQKRVLIHRSDKAKFLFILITFFLTFSRANILAIIVVVFFVAWKYIPYKKVFMFGIFAVIGVLIMGYFIQENYGIIRKLVNWIIMSITFDESSAAGRAGIWKTGFQAVQNNPLGIGFGKVGSWAQTEGVSRFYHCENSYLAIALDLGIPGLLAYLLWVVNIYGRTRVFKDIDQHGAQMVVAVLLYMCITMFFSNHIYDMEAMIVGYAIIGVSICNMNIKKKKLVSRTLNT